MLKKKKVYIATFLRLAVIPAVLIAALFGIKTLANALGTGFPELSREQIQAVIADCGYEPTIRGERLDIAQFTSLSDALNEALGQSGS